MQRMWLTTHPIPCQSLASLELRMLPYYHPGHEGAIVVVVVCPRGIGCGPTLSQVTVAVAAGVRI